MAATAALAMARPLLQRMCVDAARRGGAASAVRTRPSGAAISVRPDNCASVWPSNAIEIPHALCMLMRCVVRTNNTHTVSYTPINSARVIRAIYGRTEYVDVARTSHAHARSHAYAYSAALLRGQCNCLMDRDRAHATEREMRVRDAFWRGAQSGTVRVLMRREDRWISHASGGAKLVFHTARA